MYFVSSFVVLCVAFPETEGKSLQQIEFYFSDKTRKITDRHIRPIVQPTFVNENTVSTTSTVAHDNKSFTP